MNGNMNELLCSTKDANARKETTFLNALSGRLAK